MTRVCIHSGSPHATLLLTESVTRSSLKSIFQLSAYIDLYNVTLKMESKNKFQIPIYDIQFNDALSSPISFQKNVRIDNRSFSTIDNIEEHLIKFYGSNYRYPKISSK